MEDAGLTLRGMTSLVTRKRSRWKSDTMLRKEVELDWDRYVDKLWKSCGDRADTSQEAGWRLEVNSNV